MKRGEVDTFRKLKVQLMSFYDELALLSKKNPTDAVNMFKLRFINILLAQANQLLGAKYLPFDEFDQFEEDAVPQNSDVVLILSQYLECFEKMRADNVTHRLGSWYWVVDAEPGEKSTEDGKVYISTICPKRLRE